eukprot:SAG22_NODE_2630_length_2357_cov_1.340567_5_plen_26_part_01
MLILCVSFQFGQKRKCDMVGLKPRTN